MHLAPRLSGFVVLALPFCAHAACTRDDAFNKMMALNQFGMKLQASLPDPLKQPEVYNAKYPRVTEFGTRLAAVGKTLAAEQYDQACTTYDALAKDYGVDYAAQKVRPISALEADKPAPGHCDLAEAARRSMWLTETFQKHAEASSMTRDDWRRFGKQTEPVGLMMQQDPDKACALIDTIAAGYGFHRP